MRENTKHFSFIATQLGILAIIFFATAGYISYTQSEIVNKLDTDIRVRVEHARVIARIMRDNGVDTFTSTHIADCGARAEFEDLLIRLSHSTPEEQERLQELMEVCGKYHATRAAIMTERLDLAVSSLQYVVAIKSRLRYTPEDEELVQHFTTLLSYERERSKYLLEEYELQNEILRDLSSEASNFTIQNSLSRATELTAKLRDVNARLQSAREVLSV